MRAVMVGHENIRVYLDDGIWLDGCSIRHVVTLPTVLLNCAFTNEALSEYISDWSRVGQLS